MRAVALAAVAVTLVCARAMPMFEEDVEEVTCPPGMAFNACGTPCHKTCASEASGKPGRMCIQVRERVTECQQQGREQRQRDKREGEKGGR
jgi:hypothetical protein